MAARPRSYKIDTPNLYCKLDKRTNKVYWQYRHPATGTFIGFGTDADAARAAAVEMNRMHTEQKLEQAFSILDLAAKKSPKPITTTITEWVIKYSEILDKRVLKKELSTTTAKDRKASANKLAARMPRTALTDVGAREMAAIIEEYTDQDKNRMAQAVRAAWIDMFKEAQYAGEVPPNFNPAEATKKPAAPVDRQRLSLDDWQKIFNEAERYAPSVSNAMLLAVVTGQRLGDVVSMKFSDVWDDMLHVEQGKGGARIAIPLALRCEALNLSVRDVIARCRDRSLSKYLVHHIKKKGCTNIGDPVSKGSLSKKFSACREAVNIPTVKDKTPSTFHEQRSLSERLYRKQGINTQILLGHSDPKMTDLYHDERDNKWVIVAL